MAVAIFEAAYSRGLWPALRARADPKEASMSDPKQAAQGSAATAKRSLKYHEMTPRQKLTFILKLAVCIISFGMIYPNLMSD